ncbi:MAG: hypothetical protein Q8R01_01635 [Ramlibacter sp.]|nr:hypothetical protein [Ramlibacter sp.]
METTAALAGRVVRAVLNGEIAAPGSCIRGPNLWNTTVPKHCDGVDCWHPWMASPAPAALNMSTLFQTCLNNGRIFPEGHAMSRDVTHDRVHPLSEAILATMENPRLHPDFGTVYDGYLMGIPYVVVSGSKYSGVRVSFLYGSESDAGPHIIPEHAPVESGDCDSNGDRHILVLDADTCKVHELFKAVYIHFEHRAWLGVSLSADSGAVFDPTKVEHRTKGFTSTDAAGLSVFAGLL